MIPVKLASEKTSIYAWHDINAIYGVCALFAVVVFIFAVIGVRAAAAIPAYRGYVWLPALLMILSGTVLTTSLFRLARRVYFALQDRYDW